MVNPGLEPHIFPLENWGKDHLNLMAEAIPLREKKQRTLPRCDGLNNFDGMYFYDLFILPLLT